MSASRCLNRKASNTCMETLDVNVVSVQRVSSAFLPLLSLAAQKKLVVITSDLGPINTAERYATTAPYSPYKISKAAVTMLTMQHAPGAEPQKCHCLHAEPGLAAPVWKATTSESGMFLSVYVDGDVYYDGENLPR
ncbi:hypothetical protein OIDMADRAFT_58279 [Oidiodendron maius Zn]|uniref:Uncharacterized protein n=1 Tax=Oidiodendron maius (strain Zn) TaxID=913774 RepID=A0A0C3D454_OIDMZ|nr:hypothetical protein OIDMADRAFT_58279 [Oidiodendron maius Zn]